ncbi:hypothetical protein [Methanococcoides seepicolus]|uniref:Uncharacterized protein n=1 Tax=Methanococcoides seepicolus TaxID=2828780 RepID=A0A9E4ZDL4_9EURY|nr:hypothetical protein [Methanococcoides seepicolus]MCM1985972.1 hypothetical protein [Methanococcoides seepicolus]
MNRDKYTSEQNIFESQALTHSQICQKATTFIGIYFLLVFGGIDGKYESIFSADLNGKAVIVIYPGICTISKNDQLRISGKWHSGKKIGVDDRYIKASRIENMSLGLVFVADKSII